MGVTTVVASSDNRRGHIDFGANPSPHLYLLDSVGSTDDWSLLVSHPGWTTKLREGVRPVELSPEDTLRQMIDTAKLGTKVFWLGHNITAANAQWIIAHAHQMGLWATTLPPPTPSGSSPTPTRWGLLPTANLPPRPIASGLTPAWTRCCTWAATNWASFPTNCCVRFETTPKGPPPLPPTTTPSACRLPTPTFAITPTSWPLITLR